MKPLHYQCLAIWGIIASLLLERSDAAGHKTSACLAMIMKNEGPILPRLFDSIRGFVSEYCVMDTGSTDDTVDVLKSIDMPGKILHGPFINFAQARNAMINQCRDVMTTCDYFVLLDADMVLRVDPAWNWDDLDDKDVYNMIQISSVEYENVRVIRRTADRIKVVGATHEYYDVPDNYTRGLISKDLVYIHDVGDGKAKGDKSERDERLLREELANDPNNPRTVFYLANTLRDMGRQADAIPYYEQRSRMDNGWWVERDYAVYMLSRCYLALNDIANARKYGELAASISNRAEPLYDLIYYLHHREQYALAWYYYTLASGIPKPPVDKALFIVLDIYAFWLDFEQATLSRHIYPTQPTLVLKAGLSFLNNMHAPQYLRNYFYKGDWGLHSVQFLETDMTYHHYNATHANKFWQFILHPTSLSASDNTTEVDKSCPFSIMDQNGPEELLSLMDEETLPNHLPLFAAMPEMEVSCIDQWYPMQIGEVVEGACEVHTSVATPRIFSFLSKGSNGAQYQDDTWFLAKSYTDDTASGRVLFHLVVLDSTSRIKSYTLPFMLRETPSDTNAKTALFLREDEIFIVFIGSGDGGDMTSVVHRLPLTDLGPLLVTGPKY
jgi:glycosyltransferase involved in cell wall biosynthesis